MILVASGGTTLLIPLRILLPTAAIRQDREGEGQLLYEQGGAMDVESENLATITIWAVQQNLCRQ